MTRVLACLMALCLVPSSTSARQIDGGVIGFIAQTGPNGTVITQGGPNRQPLATGRSTIRGRVVAADGGQPVRRATVRISAPELRGTRTTLTDANGRFEFRDLPAGRYSLSALKPGLIAWFHGQTQPGGSGRPVTLADNQTADNVDIAVPRAGVITGRITDDFGDPVPNARVTLLRSQFLQGQRRLMPAGNIVSTNDIGEYRLFGLAPGRYYLSAATEQQGFQPVGAVIALASTNPLEGQEARNGYAPTFFPGTADINSAQKLSVGVAETLTEINITLLPTRLATISGVAVDSQGNPLRGVVQVTTRGGMTGPGTIGGPVRPDGTFTIPNIAPGEYMLLAVIPPASPAPGARPDFAMASVNVNGDDVSGVRMSPIVPVEIRGRISFDDPATAQLVAPSAITVVPQFVDDPGGAGLGRVGGPPPQVHDDLTFQLKTAPGRIALRPLAPGLEVRAVRVNGRDVTDTGLEVGAEDVSGVEIELTNRRQEISGSVTDARGGALTDYNVVFFAQDRARWTAPFNRYFAMGRPIGDGRFKVTLPPGEYYAIALDPVDQGEWQDPEFLDRLTRQASAFPLNEGETRTLDLKLVTLQ